MCEKLDIDYVLLEALNSPDKDCGAGIAMQPNGLRILDQLGIAEKIEAATVRLADWYTYDGNGNLMNSNSIMTQFRDRFGYPLLFTERRELRRLLSDAIVRTERVKAPCLVTSIQEQDDKVIIQTNEGTSYRADIVIGADGVRSLVRKFIDASQSLRKGTPKFSNECMSISFACCYGISSATNGIVAGDRFAVYREDSTTIGFTGKDGTVFWFVFESCNRVLPLSKAPRYTHADAHELCQAISDVRIMPEVTFGDVYANRTVCFMVPLEEGVAPTWHTHRVVLVGDSAHKMTPASGMGANQAIESSAVLINELMKVKRASTSGQPLSRGILYTALKQYSNTRKRAGVAMVDETHLLTQFLLRLPGRPTAVAEKMREVTDEQLMHMTIRRWIDAPAMEDLELTVRGQFYADVMAVERAKKQALDEPSKPSKMKSGFSGKL